MKIIIGSDHAAYDLVIEIVEKYKNLNIISVNDTFESTNYPNVAKKIVDTYSKSNADLMICICGTGFGITNSVIKYSKLNGYILKDKSDIKNLSIDNKIIGFGARTTQLQVLSYFLESLNNEYN